MPKQQAKSAATAAAEQVKSILEAAEQSAASLEAAAREDAERIRAEARADAVGAREAAARLAERADELERRVDELADGVRVAVAALKDELAALRTAGAEGEPATEIDETIAETEAVAAREPDLADRGQALDADATAEEAEPLQGAEPEPLEDAEPDGVAADQPARADAPEGARLLALKMALDGMPRADTERYLMENFELEDPQALLDEVYARAGR